MFLAPAASCVDHEGVEACAWVVCVCFAFPPFDGVGTPAGIVVEEGVSYADINTNISQAVIPDDDVKLGLSICCAPSWDDLLFGHISSQSF